MAGLREQQKAATRLRLLDAAEAVFARRGFHGASVDEIAHEAGATTGALYANFAGKEDLFLQLFDHTMAQDVRDYSQASDDATTLEQVARAGADRWMQVLAERPEYFPLFIEFWAYAVRQPAVRERFAERLATFRVATGRIVAAGAQAQGIELEPDHVERLGIFVNALANGLALEKLVDPAAVPDELFGELLVLIFNGFVALAGRVTETSATERSGT
jgi:AcrR family transcriptional regulator